MANITNYLTNTPGSPKGSLGDFRHASGAFVSSTFRLAPRFKFLFHAYFEIDNTVPGMRQFGGGASEVSLLVKATSLPSMKYDSVTKNQYNRKKIVHKQMTYDPIQIRFHDDSAGLMTQLWVAYNGYFNNDVQNPKPDAWPLGNKFPKLNYGMSTNTADVRPFKRVSLYTFTQQSYEGYTLWGPRIESWALGELDYAANEVVESTMGLEYEGVTYESGTVKEGTPDGFAGHPQYDHVASPLSTYTGANVNTIYNSAPAPSSSSSVGTFTSNSIVAQRQNINIPLPVAPLISTPIQLLLDTKLTGGSVGAEFPGIGNSTVTVIASQKTVNDSLAPNTFTGSSGLAPTIT